MRGLLFFALSLPTPGRSHRSYCADPLHFTLGSIQKSLYLLLLYQFTFAQNRPKSDISGALGPIHYITLKAFAMALGDRTKCKTCFGGPRMILHAH